MKNILFAFFAIGLVNCSSQKKLETTDIPFEINQSNVQNWSGGRAESGSGTDLKIILSEVADMTFDKVYFRGRSIDCELKTENGIHTIVASYKRNDEMDTSMDEDGKNIQKTFKLLPNQAVLAYRKTDGKLKYVKIDNIKEKKPLMFKGRPKN